MEVSNCCNADIIEETDICENCKEHCDIENEERMERIEEEEHYADYSDQDEAYDRASSNLGEVI